MLRQIRSEVGILWCNLAHDSLMWPVHGQYECRSCGRRYPAFGGRRPSGTGTGGS